MPGIQSYLPQDMLSRDPLMPEVVEGVADPRVRHPNVFVHFIQEDGNQTGLPVVTMNDLRVFIRLEHEFQCCAAEEGKTRHIVVMSVKQSAVEEIVLRMRIYEEAFQIVDQSKINVAVNLLGEIGNRQVTVALRESPDPVVTHAVILGKNDLDGVSSDRQLVGQALDHIPKTSDFGNRSTFRRYHHDEHKAGPPLFDSLSGMMLTRYPWLRARQEIRCAFWRERRAGRCEAPRRRRCRCASSRSGNKADARPPPRPSGLRPAGPLAVLLAPYIPHRVCSSLAPCQRAWGPAAKCTPYFLMGPKGAKGLIRTDPSCQLER